MAKSACLLGIGDHIHLVLRNPLNQSNKRKLSRNSSGGYGRLSAVRKSRHSNTSPDGMYRWDRHLEVDTATSGHDAPNVPETYLQWLDLSPSLPLLAPTTTANKTVVPSPPGLVPYTRTATLIASRIHRPYEAVEMESVKHPKRLQQVGNYLDLL
jgi:hypothetical protein